VSVREGTARVTTFVAVSPRDAFEVFTDEIDRWWGQGPRYRAPRGAGVLSFRGADDRGESRALVETYADGAVREIGRVIVWRPSERLVFEWRNTNFAPHEVTEVEVLFEARNGGTRVTLEHRGWDALPKDHPARHGETDDAVVVARIGSWWGQLLTSLRMHASARA
jgi:uncharacterized protein YndB with AHSA1/START domain